MPTYTEEYVVFIFFWKITLLFMIYKKFLSSQFSYEYIKKTISQTFLLSCRRSLWSFCMIWFWGIFSSLILVWSLNLKKKYGKINCSVQNLLIIYLNFLLDLIVFAEPIVETSAEPYWSAEFVVVLAAAVAAEV